MRTGAVISVLSKCVYPSEHMRNKYPDRYLSCWLDGCVVETKSANTANCQDQATIIFTHNDFLNIAEQRWKPKRTNAGRKSAQK